MAWTPDDEAEAVNRSMRSAAVDQHDQPAAEPLPSEDEICAARSLLSALQQRLQSMELDLPVWLLGEEQIFGITSSYSAARARFGRNHTRGCVLGWQHFDKPDRWRLSVATVTREAAEWSEPERAIEMFDEAVRPPLYVFSLEHLEALVELLHATAQKRADAMSFANEKYATLRVLLTKLEESANRMRPVDDYTARLHADIGALKGSLSRALDRNAALEVELEDLRKEHQALHVHAAQLEEEIDALGTVKVDAAPRDPLPKFAVSMVCAVCEHELAAHDVQACFCSRCGEDRQLHSFVART